MLDRADELTTNILRQHPALRPSDTILLVDDGDPGLSRNKGIAHAKGDFIALFDGDDYYSKNWLWSGAQACSWTENAVFHPQFVLSFGESHSIQEIADQRAHAQLTPYSFIFSHPVVGPMIAPRALFEEVRYIPKTSGFGYEDWHLSCEIMARSYRHCVAKNTFLFYRRKKHNSVLKNENQNSALVPPTKLIDVLADQFLAEQNIGITSSWKPKSGERARKISKALGDRCYRLLRKTYRATKKVQTLVNAKVKRKIRDCRPVLDPRGNAERIKQALLDITSVDPSLHPTVFPAVHAYCPDLSDDLGRRLVQVYAKIRAQYDIVYLVPWVIVGGADLMIVNYANCMAAKGQKILIISTLPRDSVWASRLDKSITFLELAKVLEDVPSEKQQEFLAKLLCQLAPKNIHVINSELGYETFQKYGSALSARSRLLTTYFCDDELKDGTDIGYAVRYLRSLDRCTSGISTDNTRLIEKWHDLYGVDEDKFTVVRGYIQENCIRDVANLKNTLSRRILWAGRICRQKRPDILLKIAQKMPDLHFDVYGGIEADDEMKSIAQRLSALKNVTLHGAYNGFQSLPIEKFRCFLYTSQYDGLPNILLEIAAAGLPIVAPDVGGIRDFITDETGWLISPHEDIHAYIGAIREIFHSPEKVGERRAKAQHVLRKIYSQNNFENNLCAFYAPCSRIW